QAEQTSTLIWPLVTVERVSNELPQVHVTVVATYSGWMSFFMISLWLPPGPSTDLVTVNRGRRVRRLADQRSIVPDGAAARPAAVPVAARAEARRARGLGRSIARALSSRRWLLLAVVVAARGGLGHLEQELGIGLVLLELAQEQLCGGLGLETREHATQLPHDLELLVADEDLLTARAGRVDVHGREDAAV